LGGDDINAKLNKAEEQRRSSNASCESEDKCYCSMGETLDGSTTWCDSDSCASVSKCYCAPERKSSPGKKSEPTNGGTKKGKANRSRKGNNLALDYELFTVGGNGRHVKPTEALSVKKSVEMAAVFADVKLSQTTDITNLKAANGKDKKTQKPRHHHKKHHETDGHVKNFTKAINESHFKLKDISSEVILRKDIEVKRMTKTESYYQSIVPRPVSASLEDSLGYLP